MVSLLLYHACIYICYKIPPKYCSPKLQYHRSLSRVFLLSVLWNILPLSVSLSLPVCYWAPYPDHNLCNIPVYHLGTIFLLTICATFLCTNWVLYSCLQPEQHFLALLLPFLSNVPSYDFFALSALCFTLCTYAFMLFCVFALLGHITFLWSLVKWPSSSPPHHWLQKPLTHTPHTYCNLWCWFCDLHPLLLHKTHITIVASYISQSLVWRIILFLTLSQVLLLRTLKCLVVCIKRNTRPEAF